MTARTVCGYDTRWCCRLAPEKEDEVGLVGIPVLSHARLTSPGKVHSFAEQAEAEAGVQLSLEWTGHA